MKTARTNARRIAITCVVAVLSLQPLAAQKNAKEAEKPQNPEDYKMLLPGENQKLLEPFVGKWEATLRTWGHGTPPPESSMKQTMDTRWVMDGYFLQTDFTSQSAGADAPFQGVIYRGYNPSLQHHVSIQLSNGDAREIVSAGSYDAATKTFTFQSQEKDPHLGDTFVRKDVYTFDGPDQLTYQLRFGFKDGSEIKAAEGTFKRVK
jgi:hypothetical protein